MRKRQRKKNARTPRWLKKFNKKHGIKMEKPSKRALKVILSSGELGHINGFQIITSERIR
jgi:hypothetical protein